jgi:hypothetical protein
MRRTSAIAACIVTALALFGALAGPASAVPAGFSPVVTCTSFTGTVTFAPGVTNKSHNTTMIVNGKISGCSNQGTSMPGTGTFNATLPGAATCNAIQEMGNFNINWPGGFFNPTQGMVTISGPNPKAGGNYMVSGSTTGGAFASAIMNSAYVITGTNKGATCKAGHALTKQNFTNTAPLQIERNFG